MELISYGDTLIMQERSDAERRAITWLATAFTKALARKKAESYGANCFCRFRKTNLNKKWIDHFYTSEIGYFVLLKICHFLVHPSKCLVAFIGTTVL